MRKIGFRLILATLFVLAVASIAGLAVRAENDEESNVFRARLSGFGEAPNPILADGQAKFVGTLSEDETKMDWTLDWTGLTGKALVAHIHFGPPQNTGNPVVFFCGGGGRPACPDDGAGGGSISGTWASADIVAVPAQGVVAGDFAGFVKILRHRLGYANIHTTAHGGGEIRGQVHSPRHHEREHDRGHEDKEKN